MVLHVFTCKWSNPVRNKHFCFQVWLLRRCHRSAGARQRLLPPAATVFHFFSHLTFITLILHLITSFLLLSHRARQAPAVFTVLWSGPAQLEANTPADTGKDHKHQTAHGLPGSLGFPGRVRGFVSLASDTQWSSVSPHLALEFLRGGSGAGRASIQKTENIVPVEVNTFHRRPANLPPSFKGECVQNSLKKTKSQKERKKEPSAYI